MAGLPSFDLKKGLISTAGVSNKGSRDLTPSKPLKMAIIPVNQAVNPVLSTLILNPESIQETKSANWVRHNIPGQSDPLLQWINGSERTITFMAFVSLDIAENLTMKEGSEEWTLEATPELSRVQQNTSAFNANILSRLATATLQPLPISQEELARRDQGAKRWKVSIQPQLDFYRSLLLPRTSSVSNQNRTPPVVRLEMGDILGAEEFSRKQTYILAAYSINILQASPDMLPTQAEVVFTFIEYNDRSKNFTAAATPFVDRDKAQFKNDIREQQPQNIQTLPAVQDGGFRGRVA